jgi:ectoine hydroxylase-related dioxygenase (phytanoyl-CoA dioxygenase family)
MVGLYDFMDRAIATELGVSVEEYIAKIESCDRHVAKEIIDLVLEDKVKEAKEKFDGLK